ncbi:uncharacterized protein PSFLO_05799 [Pseudozyma flocculosa]|uniref:Uncharacterized protein n=1 Tax=Pseudozyma flocculosa TaxID=84751 RepID=A0A5C3F9A5_9BASI|nr:uncharacterized protein PSFLO_05799 [Pseudozyma flocculosa]
MKEKVDPSSRRRSVTGIDRGASSRAGRTTRPAPCAGVAPASNKISEGWQLAQRQDRGPLRIPVGEPGDQQPPACLARSSVPAGKQTAKPSREDDDDDDDDDDGEEI